MAVSDVWALQWSVNTEKFNFKYLLWSKICTICTIADENTLSFIFTCAPWKFQQDSPECWPVRTLHIFPVLVSIQEKISHVNYEIYLRRLR